MSNLVGKIDATTDSKTVATKVAELKAAIAAGFTPNAFACKLPLGESTGKTNGAKEFRTWEKGDLKGMILTVLATFNGIDERITCSTLAEWESFGVNSPITVNVKLNAKEEKVAKIVATKVTVDAPKTTKAKTKA